LLRVVLNGLSVKDLTVVLAGIEVLVIVLGQGDLLLVVTQLQICDIVFGLNRSIVGTTFLLFLFTLLALLLQLLGRLLWLAGKVTGADLAAQDAGLCPIALCNAECNLLQNELGLFAACHGTEGLDLQLAQNVGGGVDVSLALLDV